jgi:hypothetical protein
MATDRVVATYQSPQAVNCISFALDGQSFFVAANGGCVFRFPVPTVRAACCRAMLRLP